MKKIKDYKIGDKVNFIFLGERQTGVVLEVFEKESKLSVRGTRGVIHQVRASEKESQYCYLV
jgi:hypothetical protein